MGAYRPRELAGVMLALNCVLVLPFTPAVAHWHGGAGVLALHAASVATLLVSTVCAFGLLSHGSATSVALVQSLAPLPAVLLGAALLSTAVAPSRVVAALVLTVAVASPLRGAFGALAAGRAVALVAIGAITTALLTVFTKLLLDHGLGMIEIYSVRTAGAGLVALAAFPPRSIPARALPGLAVRAAAITAFFLLSIAALADSDAGTVQATVATTPLMLALAGAAAARRLPPVAVVLASLAAPLSIAVLASGAR